MMEVFTALKLNYVMMIAGEFRLLIIYYKDSVYFMKTHDLVMIFINFRSFLKINFFEFAAHVF